ncbi:MAG TPA: bifunctional diaminohydroxyphosphoribosylaminopyrimidine deaminase/5-amino-6-(5-phosphoribosylamino)uracil reductase RibD [Geobacteraceae bacterium]|nr:bifunctional diaminohydroxyphosphoribosylaminopyrimidine deaminase/5-amino-6-(5-phosphoribosylamino)uracil reductase RibD [Geobacteraceae bacterium]
MTDFHEKMMRRALVLARKGVGRTSPNPAVGCVIVRNGSIVGEGWHRKAGTPHAEIHALSMAGELSRGADIYVTLEPCSHFGKTPPCADTLIEAGVGRVFAGMVDPNPQVSGSGMEKLRSAGIDAIAGLLENECRTVNEPFIKHVTTGLPFVVLKSALTMDGKSATASGDARWITSERSRHYVHRIRSQVDAIMVGVGTVIADDPELTCRIAGGRDPLRVVVDSMLRISPAARILNLKSEARTLVATITGDKGKAAAIRERGAEVLLCRGKDGRVDLQDMLVRLGRMNVQSLLLEGGSTLAGEALRLGLIDKALLFYAPKLVGGEGPGLFAGMGIERMDDAIRLKDVRFRRFAEDIMIEGYPEMSCSPV